MENQKFFGKYRGIVLNNIDPLYRGRIIVEVPDVLGTEVSGWALPCVPYAGRNVGFLALPPVGASVWVEFEQGDPDFPIWSGCFWAEGEMPMIPDAARTKIFKTESNYLVMSDVPGQEGLTLEIDTIPMKMVFNSSGFKINYKTSEIYLAP
jgi:hypothetical protein